VKYPVASHSPRPSSSAAIVNMFCLKIYGAVRQRDITRAGTPDPMPSRKVKKGPSTAAIGSGMDKSSGQKMLPMHVSTNNTPYIIATVLARLVIFLGLFLPNVHIHR